MGLPERVASPDQSHSLRVVHIHAPEDVADVWGGADGIRYAEMALGVDVNEAYLDAAQGLRAVPVEFAGVEAGLVV